VQGITDMKVKSVTPREAQVELQFSGSVDRLRLMLAQSDLVLSSPANDSLQYSLYLKKLAPY
jgi:hypothetical protein